MRAFLLASLGLVSLGLAASAALLEPAKLQDRGGGRSAPPKPPPKPQPGPFEGRRDAAGPRGGGRPAPERGAGERRAPVVVDMELGELYFRVADYDGDGVISWREARDSLRLDKHRFERMDANGDAVIQREEFLASYRSTVETHGSFPPPTPLPGSEGERLLGGATAGAKPELWPSRPAESVLALFGALEEREDPQSLVPSPPRIAGPVDVFHRLDLDRDGRISEADLDALQRPVQLRVRRNTILATLDTNGDGVIDRDEFYAAMGKR